MLDLMFITNEEEMALEAESAGVDRIFIDLEIKGKYERQGHLDTHIANHRIEDISKIKTIIKKSQILVRINPFYEGTKNEVDECIRYGADILMLPMFTTNFEVEQFIKYVDGRATVCLLLETSQAFVRINQILSINGIDEIHLGLNDLHLSLGLDFMFELLSEGIVEYLGNLIQKKNIKFGFGGIARIGEGDVPAELILGEHYRLGSQMAILSRSFRSNKSSEINVPIDINSEVKKVRDVENNIKTWSNDKVISNCQLVKEKVREIAKRRIKK
ncbi:aldolase/citrate lyase family protein [Sedimentibacter sp.]|uniref:aldolase/citrate lyase family protein n=1 Tax=Sedimentibacter sp. TaxID=1960295 RepID=UPI00289CCA59|nr:aldolase/citrate lyase family protein [Sedimentibacter sp.]